MRSEQYVRAFAGTFILVSLFLAWVHSAWWLALTVFVGANLLQSAFTGICPLEMILEKLGVEK